MARNTQRADFGYYVSIPLVSGQGYDKPRGRKKCADASLNPFGIRARVRRNQGSGDCRAKPVSIPLVSGQGYDQYRQEVRPLRRVSIPLVSGQGYDGIRADERRRVASLNPFGIRARVRPQPHRRKRSCTSQSLWYQGKGTTRRQGLAPVMVGLNPFGIRARVRLKRQQQLQLQITSQSLWYQGKGTTRTDERAHQQTAVSIPLVSGQGYDKSASVIPHRPRTSQSLWYQGKGTTHRQSRRDQGRSLNPFGIRARVRHSGVRESSGLARSQSLWYQGKGTTVSAGGAFPIPIRSQSLWYQGKGTTWMRCTYPLAATSLNPFGIRARVRHIRPFSSSRRSGSQSLWYQGKGTTASGGGSVSGARSQSLWYQGKGTTTYRIRTTIGLVSQSLWYQGKGTTPRLIA